MSEAAKPEALFGLPDLGQLDKYLDAFNEIKAFINELKAFYAEHQAAIAGGLEALKEFAALLRKLKEFISGLFGEPGTAGGFQS